MSRRELPHALQWKELCTEGQETQVLVPALPQASDRALSSSKSFPWACFLIRNIGTPMPTLEASRDVGRIF